MRFLFVKTICGGVTVGRQDSPAAVTPGIPLGEAERAAIEDGVAAYENLLSKLADVPSPAGPTHRQIGAELVQITSLKPALLDFVGD